MKKQNEIPQRPAAEGVTVQWPLQLEANMKSETVESVCGEKRELCV